MQMQIKNFILDMGNVLVDLDYTLWQENMDRILHPHTLEDIYPLIHKYDTGLISTELFINGVLKLCSHRIHALDVIQAWNSLIIGMKSFTYDSLVQMSQQYELALLSNNNPLHQQWVYQYTSQKFAIKSFDNFFKNAFYSHEIGLRKPTQKCYQYVQKLLGWKLRETLFVDDMDENIEAAKVLGWNTYKMKTNNKLDDVIKFAHSL